MRFIDITIENNTVSLDGNEYIACDFIKCTLKYSGLSPCCFDDNCTFHKCTPMFDGQGLTELNKESSPAFIKLNTVDVQNIALVNKFASLWDSDKKLVSWLLNKKRTRYIATDSESQTLHYVSPEFTYGSSGDGSYTTSMVIHESCGI